MPFSSTAFAVHQTAVLDRATTLATEPAPRRAARLPPNSPAKSKPVKSKGKFRTALNEWMGHMSGTATPAQNFRTPLPISTPLPPSAAALASAAQEKERQQKVDKLRQATRAMKQGGTNLMRRIKKKLNSKTPKEELPTTFEEYSSRYANGEIDLNDPPEPPHKLVTGEPSPFEQRVFLPPTPANEIERQEVVNKLDLLGSRAQAKRAELDAASLAPSMAASESDTVSLFRASAAPSDHDQAVASIKNHPVFRSIVAKCRDMFDSKVGMLTIMDDEQQVFLVTGGMELGNSLPRSVTFCAHAMLDDDNDGMVVLDAQNDWRFANGMPTTALGARFYAGVPLMAPTFGDPSAPSVPLGTLCVVDDKPREAFTEEQRQVLHDLAAQATKEVELWVNARMAGKLSRLEYDFRASSTTLPLAAAEEIDEDQIERQESEENPENESETPAIIDADATPTKPIADEYVSVPTVASPTPTSTSRTVQTPDIAREQGSRAQGDAESIRSRRAGPAPTGGLPLPPFAPHLTMPLTPPESLSAKKRAPQHSRMYSDTSVASVASSAAMSATASSSSVRSSRSVRSESSSSPPIRPHRERVTELGQQRRPSAALSLSLAVTTEAPVTAVPKESQRVFDQAVTLLAQALNMSLVYLAAIDLAPSTSIAGQPAEPVLRLLAAEGLPDPAPAFDPALHIKALRAPEGGLLYRNPRSGAADGTSGSQVATVGYASGILIPVLEVRRIGYVLSGYTRDPTRAFVQRDLASMVRLAESLEYHVASLGRPSI